MAEERTNASESTVIEQWENEPIELETLFPVIQSTLIQYNQIIEAFEHSPVIGFLGPAALATLVGLVCANLLGSSATGTALCAALNALWLMTVFAVTGPQWSRFMYNHPVLAAYITLCRGGKKLRLELLDKPDDPMWNVVREHMALYAKYSFKYERRLKAIQTDVVGRLCYQSSLSGL